MVQYIGERVRRLGKYFRRKERRLFEGVPPGNEGDMMERMERSAAVMLEAWKRYVPEPYDGDLLLLRASRRDSIDGLYREEPTMGWGPFVRGRITTRWVDTTHIQMLDVPYCIETAAHLAEAIAAGHDALQADRHPQRE